MALDTRTVMELRATRTLLERAMATYGTEVHLVLRDARGEGTTATLIEHLRARVDVLHAEALARRPACRAMLAGRRSGIARRLEGLRREIALFETWAAAPRGDGGHAR